MLGLHKFQSLAKVLLIAGALCAHMAHADSFQMPSLSQKYKDAQDMLTRYRPSNPPHHSPDDPDPAYDPLPSPDRTSDPTWSPSFGNAPSQPTPPPERIEVAIEKEIQLREKRLGKLVHMREVWRVMSENIRNQQRWESELKTWAEDTKAAQVGALMASSSLLFGLGGPVADAIEVHSSHSTALWSAALARRKELEEFKTILFELKQLGATNPKLLAATKELQLAYDALTAALKSELAMVAFFKNISWFADRTGEAIQLMEFDRDVKATQSLFFFRKVLEDFVVGICKDAGLMLARKELIKRGLTGSAGFISLANFGIDYGYNSLKFYFAWSNINDILDQQHSELSRLAILSTNIVSATDQANEIRRELSALKKARDTRTARRQVLDDLHLKDIGKARAAGEWFSQQTGIRAPGSPINDGES